MASDKCTDSSGHNWVLKEEGKDGVWGYGPKYSFWKKTRRYITDKDNSLFWEPKQYFVLRFWKDWYCSKCREFERTEDEVNTIEDIVAQDLVVYDWENEVYIYPKNVAIPPKRS